jgi:hypothetical protein
VDKLVADRGVVETLARYPKSHPNNRADDDGNACA